MPRNGSGSYSLPTNSWFPAVNGVTATSTDWNTTAQDIQAALTQSISSDGQTPMTGNLQMGNNKITGLAAGTANTDAINFTQQVGRLIGVQVFTANGTYTPTTGTTSIIVEMVGGGGGGGGSNPTAAGQVGLGQSGGGGSYARGRFTSAFAGLTVTVGGGGTGGAISGAGGAGGQSSLGALITAPGGSPGGTVASGATTGVAGAAGGVAGTGGNILQLPGQSTAPLLVRFADGSTVGLSGGSSFFGMGPPAPITNTNAGGNAPAATAWGAGGSGPATYASQGGSSGGAGRQGIVIIYEYA